MDSVFRKYIDYWLTAPIQIKFERIVQLHQTGRLLIEQSLKAQNLLPEEPRAKKISIARRMYVADPQTQRLIDIAEARNSN